MARAWQASRCGSVCSRPPRLSAPAQKGGTLRLSSILDVDSVDPAIAYGPQSWMLEYATCAELYNYPDKPAPQGAIVVPEVATGFPKVSADGKTQTIKLKRTYRFDTGARVTAANYVAAFNRDANPKLAVAGSSRRLPARDRGRGRRHRRQGADDLRRQGARTVHAADPDDEAPARPGLAPDDALLLSDRGQHPAYRDRQPARLGPYYVASRVPNRQVVLERNRFYRGPRPANVDQFV